MRGRAIAELPAKFISSRTFDREGQDSFAALSGDRNPMHLDLVAARRTLAGAPVVHGVHTLLWALDALAPSAGEHGRLTRLRVRFDEMVFVGETAGLAVRSLDTSGVAADVMVDGSVAVRIQGTFGTSMPSGVSKFGGTGVARPWLCTPINLSLEEMSHADGHAAFGNLSGFAAAFPAAVEWLEAEPVAALGATTYVVGMVCPGLHSIFGGLSIEFGDADAREHALSYRTKLIDPRFRLVRLEIEGGGLHGTVDSFARRPPQPQASTRDLRRRLNPEEFAGLRVLVVGGSRGLGEVAAKLSAAGGADVTITYAVGEADARHVCEDIAAAGSRAGHARVDVREPLGPQLATLGAFDALCFLATPQIAHRKASVFSPDRFCQFSRYYLEAFQEACLALLEAHEKPLAVFYPSTSFIDHRPAKMTEYVMAKAAAEVLCQDLTESYKRLRIVTKRVPRLPTDQTNALSELEMDDPIDYLLPVIRETYGQLRRDEPL